MKILHTADWHIEGKGNFPGKTETTITCLNWMVDQAREIKPDLQVVAGDIFNKAKVWLDRGVTEVITAAEMILKMAEISPVVIIKGTPNHDGTEQYTLLQEIIGSNPQITIITTPQKTIIETSDGPIQVIGVPAIVHGNFRSQNAGLSAAEENQSISDGIMELITDLRLSCTDPSPIMLLTHYTVTGANTESGQTMLFSEQEVVLDRGILQTLDFDLIALGHIHRPQEVAPNIFYAGAINATNFGDEGQSRGFYLHTLGEQAIFYETPYQKYLTLRFLNDEIEAFNQGEVICDAAIKDKIIRVLYSANLETINQFNHTLLERELLRGEARWIQEITCINSLDDGSEQTLMGNDPLLNIEEYFKEDDDVSELVALARPVFEDKIDEVKTRGRLTPVSLEVKNYRNYPKETVDYSTIDFAVVIGENGAGKSSLFMDALIDCLYEQTREGDLRGWLSNRPEAKSGCITLTFTIDNNLYRVVRTRAKSGKATLALNLYNDDEWTDIGGTKLKDTQDAINLLIGDVQTVKSCNVIMQDQYGVFLEADRSERMQVFAGLIGLDIYVMAKEAFAEMSTEYKRELNTTHALKEKAVTAINEEVNLPDDLKSCRENLANLELQKEAMAKELKKARENMEIQKESRLVDEKLNELDKQQQQMVLTINQLQNDIKQLDVSLNKEKELLCQVEKAKEIEKAMESINHKISDIRVHEQTIIKYQAELNDQEGQRIALNERLKTVQSVLLNEATIVTGANAYKRLQAELNTIINQSVTYTQLTEQLQKHKSVLALEKQKFEGDYHQRVIDYKTAEKNAKLILSTGCSGKLPCPFISQASKVDLKKMLADNVSWKQQQLLEMKKVEDKVNALLEEISKLNFDPNSVEVMSKNMKSLEDDYQKAQQFNLYHDQEKDLIVRVAKLNAAIEGTIKQIEVEMACVSEQLPLKQQLSTYSDQLAALQADLAESKNLDGSRRIKALKENELNKQEEIRRNLSGQHEQLTKKQIELASKQVVTEPITAIEAQVQTIENQLKHWYYQEAKLNVRKELLEKNEMALAEYDEQIRLASKLLSQLLRLKAACDYKGIPHRIMKEEIRHIEAKANVILGQMTNGQMQVSFDTEKLVKNGTVKEIPVLDVTIHENGMGVLPYSSKSGGERVKVSLATALALAEVKASKSGLQLGFLFVDEPPFLDESGTEAYCDALETIRHRYAGLKVIAITHDQSMQTRFVQTINILKTENGSQIAN